MNGDLLNGRQGKFWSVKNEKLTYSLLFAIILSLGSAAYFAWDRSAFGGNLQSEDHVRLKRKQEIEKRFSEGVLMLRSKQYEPALKAFHRVIELAPKMSEAYVNSGFALLGMGEPKAAADYFDGATTLKPDQMNAYFGLGEALQDMGDTNGALQAMETYLHRSAADDPFRRRAESAVWELRAALEKEKADEPAGDVPQPHTELKSQ